MHQLKLQLIGIAQFLEFALARKQRLRVQIQFVIKRALAAHDFVKLFAIHTPSRSSLPSRVPTSTSATWRTSTGRIPPNCFCTENALAFGAARRTRGLGRVAQLFAMALHFAQRVDRLVL